MVLHRVSNKILVGIGGFSYTISFLLFAVAKTDFPHWACLFPGLILNVVGADFEFNVTNMYVVSTLPSQQSVAGDLLQTITRLCTTIAFGISTAAYNAAQKLPSNSRYYAGDPIEPYSATFSFSFARRGLRVAVIALIYDWNAGHHDGHQGGQEKEQPVDVASPVEDKRLDTSIDEKGIEPGQGEVHG